MFKVALAVVTALILFVLGFIFLSGKEVSLQLAKPVKAIGTNTPVAIQASNPHGIKSFRVYVEQGAQRQQVFADDAHSANRTYTFGVGQKSASFLKEGAARLIVEARSNDLRSAKSTLTQDVQVVLKPPFIVPDGRQHYLNQGGAELVTFDTGGNWSEAGVRAGKYTADSFPMPGQPDTSTHRFSLFPFPWDLRADVIPVAVVCNSAGTEVTAPFWVKVFPKKFRSSDIQLNDRNIQKVISELDPNGTGSPIERFVRINNVMRKENNQTIYDLHTKTEKRILWSGPFVPIKGTRESYFADRRSYYYGGRKVDEQVHLGFDLAQTSNMPVTAANSGKVIWADRLGIYGNCVILDHGYSLQTLYGHMSKINVKVGDAITKGQVMGISGSTGMAFGDHVHFSMLIAGIQVNPIEWWDEHWIHDRILSKISPQ